MADTNAAINKVTTGKVRFSYAQTLFTADEKGAYSVCLLVPKSDTDTLTRIKAAIEKAKTDPKSTAKWGSKWLASMKNPLRDGDTERDTEKSPEYKGHYFINANTYTRPGIVDAQLNPILDKSELKSGDYGRVTIVPAAYSQDGNKGLKFYLNNVQKLASGEALGGTAGRAEDDFTAVTDDFLN